MGNALHHGNRLVVGVMSDEDTMEYKRRPIMTTKERCAEVANCKFVSQVIPNAPCFGLTKEFLLEHNIHVVSYGEGYSRPGGRYSQAAQVHGIEVESPRTDGISTSGVIKRIAATTSGELRARDKVEEATKKRGK